MQLHFGRHFGGLRRFALPGTGWQSVSAIVLFCLLAVGCGGDAKNNAAPVADADGSAAGRSPVGTPPEEGTVYSYKLSEISPIGDYLPPLDGGRVEFAPPKDWKVGSRQAKLVVWFHEFKDPKLLPQIRVTAEDPPEGAPQEATVAGAKAYAQWVDEWIKSQIGEEKLLEPVVPLVLGENAFGRFVRAGSYKSSTAERQILVTTKAGRVYTIELIVYEGTLKKNDRKTILDGYAVGGYMKAAEAANGGFVPSGE